MKRLIYDVPRWHLYLHRQARALDVARAEDPPLLKLEDELFERFYSGEAERLPASKRSPETADWAEKIHGQCDQLPSFSRLAAECRGDADAAAAAVSALMGELRPGLSGQDPGTSGVRKTIRQGCDRASAVVEELREVIEALGQVVLAPVPGHGSAAGNGQLSGHVRGLAARLRHDGRLKQIALLAGRFKRIAAAKRRQKVRHGVDEVTDIEQGSDLGRLLPVELAKLVHPRLRMAMLRDLLEHRCLQYQLRGPQDLGRGPLVVCLDKSGSMEGERDIWASAVALALMDLAQHQHRPFALLHFDGRVKFEVVVQPGEHLPEGALAAAGDGGTSIDSVVDRALEIISQHPGALRKADVVLITDGLSSADRAAGLKAKADLMSTTVLGVGIGVDPAGLGPWCHLTLGITDLGRIEQQAAEALFTV
jgi:Mg-chelatase subunit ChlD